VDERQFDTLTRFLATGTSRRSGIRLLAGAGAALLALARGRDSSVFARHGTASPGDPCRTDSQCVGADAPLVCAWNGYGHDGGLNCCTSAGNRCGSDAACCGQASCIGGICSSGGSASAGNGGVASANAQGGTVSIGNINSGGNAGNTIGVGNTRGNVSVSGGTVTNTTDISASAGGGTAIANASGGSGNIAGGGSPSSCTGAGCACSTGTYSPCDSGLQCCAIYPGVPGGAGVCQYSC
jgi:hypothetical protein